MFTFVLFPIVLKRVIPQKGELPVAHWCVGQLFFYADFLEIQEIIKSVLPKQIDGDIYLDIENHEYSFYIKDPQLEWDFVPWQDIIKSEAAEENLSCNIRIDEEKEYAKTYYKVFIRYTLKQL